MNDKINLSKGVKYDQEKLRFDLIPVRPLEDLVKVYTYGAKKYTDRNWEKGISWSRIFAAIMRHMWSWWRGEECDIESGLPHLAHATWGCFTLLEYMRTHRKFDDRVKETRHYKDRKIKILGCRGEFASHTTPSESEK